MSVFRLIILQISDLFQNHNHTDALRAVCSNKYNNFNTLDTKMYFILDLNPSLVNENFLSEMSRFDQF